jgi:hypothetical protein
MLKNFDQNIYQIHNLPDLLPDLFVELDDPAMAATTGGLSIPVIGFPEAANKFAFLSRWEARFNAGNPNLPLVAQRLINGYYKGTNKPEYVANFKASSGAGWKNFAPQIFNFLPFTAGGTPEAINSAASFLALF